MLKKFFKNEDGMEFLQMVFIIVITVLIGGVIYALGDSIMGKVGDATDAVDEFNIS